MGTDLKVPARSFEGVDDAEVLWRAIEHAYAYVDASSEPAAFSEQLALLTRGQRALLAIHRCVAETFNGGFDQFFTNSTGRFADEAAAGLELVGVPEGASILREAKELLALRPGPPDYDDPQFDEAQDKQEFDSYLARYHPLEKRFGVIVDRQVYPQAAAYVRRHLSEFVA